MQTQYNLNHAQEILEPCGVLVKHLRLEKIIEKKKGVWPAIERDLLLLPETEVLRWRPARHMQHLPGAPEVNDTPMLPNPFNARELAAFMLEGAGALVADFYGDWSDGPDPESLHCIDPDSKARRAVTEAFTAHRHAIATVGKWDEAALARRDAAHKAYWKSNNDRELLQVLDHAEAEWKAAYQAWLTAMVRCLLEPQTQATPAKNGAATKWTPEYTNEVATYRENHTAAQTAEKFGVSESFIRRKLAKKKSASKPKATPFSGLVHRSK